MLAGAVKRYTCASYSPKSGGDALEEEANSDCFASEREASVCHTGCFSIFRRNHNGGECGSRSHTGVRSRLSSSVAEAAASIKSSHRLPNLLAMLPDSTDKVLREYGMSEGNTSAGCSVRIPLRKKGIKNAPWFPLLMAIKLNCSILTGTLG